MPRALKPLALRGIRTLASAYNALMHTPTPTFFAPSLVPVFGGRPEYSSAALLRQCCGILEIGGFINWEPTEVYKLKLAYQVRKAMVDTRVRLAIATTTVPTQAHIAGALGSIGFTQLTTTVNPKSENEITLWALRLG